MELKAITTNNLSMERISPLDSWPVGSIYMSMTATNPSDLFGGGSWQQIAQGRCLIGVSDEYALGVPGGEKEHKLSTDEMPSHSHSARTMTGDIYLPGCEYDSSGSAHSPSPSGVFSAGSFSSNSWSGGHVNNRNGLHLYFSGSPSIGFKGSGLAHNNMQPYLPVYIWQRTA